jgi:hypothetical protein
MIPPGGYHHAFVMFFFAMYSSHHQGAMKGLKRNQRLSIRSQIMVWLSLELSQEPLLWFGFFGYWSSAHANPKQTLHPMGPLNPPLS